MAHENINKVERVLDLGNGMSIWKVHLDALREQDKNARVMPLEKFERLTANIGGDKRLESLPLVTPKKNQADNPEFLIISGHHRIRAARSAQMEFIYVLSIDEELTHSQIRAKQLAHNALAGYDNPEVLAELYNEIDDVSEKLASGVTDSDIELEAPTVSSDDIDVNFNFEIINILFLPKQVKRRFYLYFSPFFWYNKCSDTRAIFTGSRHCGVFGDNLLQGGGNFCIYPGTSNLEQGIANQQKLDIYAM